VTKPKDNAIDKTNLIDMIRDAGVVGAGGAGFPTHVKLSAKADFVIANCAECEPLLESDKHLLLREPYKVIEGLKAAAETVGASKGIIAVKEKHKDIIEILTPLLAKGSNLELFLLGNFYPAGDEHVLVYEVTGRVVPMGGIPLNVGVVVNNAYTLAMIYDATCDKSFTHRYITVTGAVGSPCVARLPIGMSIREAIEKAGGGITVNNFRVIIGGPMTGKIEEDLEKPILKTTSGIIVLPQNSKFIEIKTSSMAVSIKRARSVCCQCSFCTDMCPRSLLGHKLAPHQIMRIVPFSNTDINTESIYSSLLCSECGLCGYFSCTMGLKPNMINEFLKGIMAKNRIRPDFKEVKPNGVNPFREGRKVPAGRLTARLGLLEYDRHLPFKDEEMDAQILVIPLKQHIGAPSVPVVNKGDRVGAGGLLAKIPDGSLGANIHCPRDGVIREVSESIVVDCD
jgi:Na+-translocating ferredoxin:NAD+ oxidoreductase RnfC subunit